MSAHNGLAAYTRRRRSTKIEHRAFLESLVQITAEVQPCTVRQVYYQAVVRGIVEKTEREYDRVQVALVKLREAGEVPWEHVVDSTRTLRRPDTWADPAAALESAARHYRKAIWTDSSVIPEVWLEKEALVGVIWDVTDEWDVGLYTSRGYASLPFLYEAAQTIVARARHGLATAIYHLGDFDPSGRDAARAIKDRLGEFCLHIYDLRGRLAALPFTFEEIAVTPAQIAEMNLPLRPTKEESRTKGFREKYGDVGSVELDAIHPDDLRELVRAAIEQHMPAEKVEALRVVEAEEREGLEVLAREWAKRGTA